MKLTVLGTAGAYPGPGGACSGYLVEADGSRLLLDCGTGVLANLQKHISFSEVSDIIVSHMHADHFLDLLPLRYALALGPTRHRISLHLPPGGQAILQSVVSFLNDPAFFVSYFDITEYQPGDLEIAGFKVKVVPVPHYVPSHAMAFTRGRKLTYSADCGPNDSLAVLGVRSDLLLTEALLLKPEDKIPRGHLTMAESAAIATRAGARRLMFSHIYPDRDYSEQIAQARKAFAGPIEVAEVNRTYEV